MKKILFAFVAAAGISSLVGCSKDYDSDPDTNLSTGSNPIAPVGTAESGQIVCKINKKTQKFGNAALGNLGGYVSFAGTRIEGTTGYILGLGIPKYSQGVKSYGGDSVIASYGFGVQNDQGNLPNTYATINGFKPGYASIQISEDNGTKLVGTFNFKAYRTDENGKAVDSVIVTEGSFNVSSK